MNHIHPTAIIYPGVILGDNVFIGAYSVIGAPPEHPDEVDPRKEAQAKVWIGDGVVIRSHVTIDSGIAASTHIGAGTYVMSHSHVGHDSYISSDCILHTFSVIGGYCVIRTNCRIGLGAVLHQRTVLAPGIMVGAQAFVKGKWLIPYRIIAGVPAKDIGENYRLKESLGI